MSPCTDEKPFGSSSVAPRANVLRRRRFRPEADQTACQTPPAAAIPGLEGAGETLDARLAGETSGLTLEQCVGIWAGLLVLGWGSVLGVCFGVARLLETAL